MMWTVGDLCCSARVKRPYDNPTRHIKGIIHGGLHMPPGDDALEKRRAERARARGEPTQEVRDRRRKITQIVGTIVSSRFVRNLKTSRERRSPVRAQVVLVLASLIWLPVDFLQRESKAPPPESSLPDPTSERYLAEQIGYILAWIGAYSKTESIRMCDANKPRTPNRLPVLDRPATLLHVRFLEAQGSRGALVRTFSSSTRVS